MGKGGNVSHPRGLSSLYTKFSLSGCLPSDARWCSEQLNNQSVALTSFLIWSLVCVSERWLCFYSHPAGIVETKCVIFDISFFADLLLHHSDAIPSHNSVTELGKCLQSSCVYTTFLFYNYHWMTARVFFINLACFLYFT